MSRKIARDARTGRTVTLKYAMENPGTTVVEEIKTHLDKARLDYMLKNFTHAHTRRSIDKLMKRDKERDKERGQ